jgi:hypothetical protein
MHLFNDPVEDEIRLTQVGVKQNLHTTDHGKRADVQLRDSEGQKFGLPNLNILGWMCARREVSPLGFL